MYDTGRTPNRKDLTSICQEKYDDYFFSTLDSLRCPHCQNPVGLRTHGRYQRHLYLNQAERIKIMVVRMICTCSKTFVVLLPEIIPFKRYVLFYILDVIRLIRVHSAYYVEQRLTISISVVRYWRKQYQTWHQVITETNDLLELTEINAIALAYNELRPARRFMQIISAWTQPFQALI